jgi:hypothetical protein
MSWMIVESLHRDRGTTTRQERQFFAGLTIAMALVTFVGFAPSYYFRSHTAPPLPLVVHIHGIVFTGWILIQVAQALLVVMNRVDLHRRFGYVAASFSVLVLATGVAVVTSTWRMAFAAMSKVAPYTFPHASFLDLATMPGPEIARSHPDAVFATAYFGLIAFAILLGAAIMLRRNPGAHKRLVLMATAELLLAPIGRFAGGLGMGGNMLLADLFIATIALRDVSVDREFRMHPATLWGGALILVSQPLRLLLTQTALSHAVMHWIALH